ncbi:DNA internalization-related competence protein ComEC/Rec2 [Enterococcus saccharolyticus]|uniref:DNA internalization-related competence protein ComEC/Rec2 n=1 Tax=Enterococcus saccharolyticus TaxID=41997 RepID=UPI001026CCE0|nr:DNA internalization-related competence protein ComEC/Rec2 [Enterococcus saccharolyticus]VFA62976.1 DNA internalization-related competence protein ComEC/Rec2 [Enterococcus saccharolyticus]
MGLHIQTCRDHFLFVGVIIGCWVTGFYLKSVLLFIIASYLLLGLLIKKQVALLALCCLGSVLIGGRMVSFQNRQLEEGSLTAEVLIYSDTIKVNGDLVTFEGKLPEGKVMGRYQVSSLSEKDQWLSRQNWQKSLRVHGNFKIAEPIRNKHAFDYSFYLASRNFLGTLTITEILASKQTAGISSIYRWRAAAVTHVKQFFPEKLASYINALLFGYKDHEFQEIRQLFSSSGLLHFFTVSGLHVSFFFYWLERGLRRGKLTREEMLLPLLPIILIAAILFGGSISVIRAVLAYGMTVLLRLFSCHLSACDRYGIVLFLTLMIDPKVFLQTSGQLCFLMTFLLLMQRNVQVSSVIRSQFLPLLAAPLLMHLFYEFPLLVGIFTLLLLPLFQRFILPSCFALFAVSLLIPKIPYLDSWSETLLHGIEEIVFFLGRFALTTGRIPIELAIFCSLLGLFLYQRHQFFFCFLVSLFLPLLLQRLFVPAAVTFVDVGQGDSIVLQTAFNREVYVIDTGGSLSFSKEAWQQRAYQENAHASLIPFLKGEGVRQIDGLFLTHGDTDHLGDALALMTAIPVKKIYLVPGSEHHPQIAALIKQLPQGTVHWTKVGETIGRDLAITVLAPESGQGENEDSLVLKAEIEKWRFLFTGDLDQKGEEKLIQLYPHLQAEVVKLGHHGSRTSTSARFIESLSPKIGIISCGKDNRYGHPHSEVLEVMEGRSILRTDQQGMIRFSWSNWHRVQQLETWLDYRLE